MKSPAKKLLSFVLITVIAASALPVYSAEAMDSTSLNDAANWYDGSSNQVSALPIVEEQSWGSVNNVTGDDVPGGAFESALRCNGNHCIAFGTKLMLEPNTTYTLSFSYYAESSAKISSESQNTACLKGVGAYPFSEELKWSDICGSMTPSNWNLCTNTENKLFNIVCTDSAKVGSNITGLCNKPSGEWNEFSATFNSQNVTEALFYFNKQSTTVDNVYIADLKLVKKSGDLNDPSAWKLYKSSSTHIGENGTPVDDWAKVTENTDAAYIKDGDSSLNFSCISQRGAAEFEVEQNKNYTISFKYYSDSLNAAGTYILSQVAVVTPNGAVGYMSEDNLSYVSSGLSYTGPYSEMETNSNSTATTETGWHDFEIGFNSGGNTRLALTILFAASPVYIDCIELNENTEAVESDDLNDPSAWKLYKNNSTHIGENGTPVDDWAKVTENTDAAYIKDGDSSLNFSCISQRGAAEFEVEQNKNYTISFKYYSDSLNAAGTYILSQVAVVTPNGAVGYMSEDNLSYVSSGLSYTGPYSEMETNSNSTATTETGWHDFEIGFNSGGNTRLALTILFAASPVYIDCIELNENTEAVESGDLNDPSAWKLYKSSSTHIGENGTPVDDWAKVTENTDAAYIKDGDSSLNFSCISQHGAAEFEVEQNKNYIISFKYYSDSLNAAGTYILSQVAVMTPNGAVGYMSEDNLSYVSSDLSYTGPYSERKTNSNSTAVTETGWHDFEIGFNSGSHTKLALRILFAASPVYVDCIELNELSVNDGGVVDITSNKGQSIRTSEPMGLRFKSNIKKSLIESGIEGFKIVEYGSVAIRTAILGEAELTLGSKGNNESGYEIAAKKGTAYKNDGTNLIFAEYDDSYDFTAVLINIGLQSNERTDYGFFAQEYSVRTYAVLERAGVQITVYDDETVNASVFDVMKAILNGGQSDDKEAVTAMLSQNSEMLAAYQEFDPDFIL